MMYKCRVELQQLKPVSTNIPLNNNKQLISHRYGKSEQTITACSMVDQDKENMQALPTQSMRYNQPYQNNKSSSQPQYDDGQYGLIVDRSNEVQSIIFDSKVTTHITQHSQSQYSPVLHPNNYLDKFRNNVDKVDAQIEASLTHLEQTIRSLKQEQTIRSLKQEQTIRSLKQKKQLKRNTESHKHTSESMNKTQQQINHQTKQPAVMDRTGDSHIQIQVDRSRQEQLPQQYISLISRLSRQIDKDIAFTNKISHHTKTNMMTQIRTQCLIQMGKFNTKEIELNQSFLKIQAAEIDPLDQPTTKHIRVLSEQEIKQQAVEISEEYTEIQTHYQHKLCHQFSPSTIQLLFTQLSQFNSISGGRIQGISVGHLLSYINMRTNRSYRNRSVVKMLKRLKLKPNSMLNMQAFGQLIKQ